MAERVKKSLKEQIRLKRQQLFELETEYRAQRYLETMPEYDPLYKYCFQTSMLICTEY